MSDVTFNNPAYRIETERLVVRCYNPFDAQMLSDAINESAEHLKPWMPWAHAAPEPVEVIYERTKKFRGNFDLGINFTYAIFNKDESCLIGGTGLHPRIGEQQIEIGYWLHKDYINQGLVTESTMALVKVAFELLHVHRVEIHCSTLNLASASIPRKLGFTHEGTLHSKMQFLDQWIDSMVWGLLDVEYPNTSSAKAVIKVFDASGTPVI